MKHANYSFSRSAQCLSAFLLVTTAFASPSFAQFNPNEGLESTTRARALPNTATLTERGRHSSKSAAFPNVTPVASNTAIPITFEPLKQEPVAAQAPATAIPPLKPVATVGFPQIDAHTLQAGGFVPPAPLIAPPPVAPEQIAAPVVAPPVSQASVAPVIAVPPAPVVAVAPTPAMPVLMAEPTAPLSRDTKAILSHIPSKLDTPKPTKAGKVTVSRISPEMHDLQVKGKVDEYEASGIKIRVRRPGLDTNFELSRAYTALAANDNTAAIEIYKNILSMEPTNQDALFGLASIYHRLGELERARTYYGTLLKHYPNHRDGLNNFLVLVSDESPQEALAELERLEQRNPDFSPIPAQQALLLNKLGYLIEARNKMLRAIDLTPENLTYKYNLAIMLDGQGHYPEAANLYRTLIEASTRGETIPAPVDTLQKRLNYIATALVGGTPVTH